MRLGDFRVIRYFAFLPTDLSDGNRVWLQFYWSIERLTFCSHLDATAQSWEVVDTSLNKPVPVTERRRK